VGDQTASSVVFEDGKGYFVSWRKLCILKFHISIIKEAGERTVRNL